MTLYLLQWPNMILHYSNFTVEFIKTPSLMLTIFLLGISGYKYIYPFRITIVFLSLVAINYVILNNIIFHSYILKSVTYAVICGAIFRVPQLIKRYLKVYMFIVGLLGLQGILLIILWAMNYHLSYEYIEFVDSNSYRYFNALMGFENSYYYFRITSYFTETNRLAYFLTPSLFIVHYYRISTGKAIYKILFYTTLITIIFTFSVFGYFAIILGVFLYYIFHRGIKVKTIMLYSGLLLLLLIFYTLSSEFFDFMFNKAGSYQDRYTGILSKLSTIKSHPYGVPERTVSYLASAKYYGNSTLTLLNWTLIGGIQSAVLLFVILAIWMKNIYSLLKSKNQFLVLIGCASFSLLMEQSFYGTYYEYYFMSWMVILSVIQYMFKRNDSRLQTLVN